MSADLTENPVALPENSGPLGEISQGPNAFEAFLDRNQKSLVGLLGLVAIGAVGLVIYRGIETSRQEAAGAALTKAGDLAAYQTVVTGNANTTAGASAMILLANSQWTADKRDDAVATLEKFISSFPDHPALPSAKANLGSKLMAQGKSAAAIKIFDDLVADPAARFIAPFALISLGDISKAAGDFEKAGASYAKVKADFPDSSFAETATKRLATYKTKAPTEIEPPPAPAPVAPPVTAVPETPPISPVAPTSKAEVLPAALPKP